MPTLTRLAALVATTLVTVPLAAQVDERDAVLHVVQRFFDTMAARDSAGAAATVIADGVFFRTNGPIGPAEPGTTFREYLASLVTGTSRLLERLWDPVVHVRRDIATVWTPYDFHVDGRFSHCGVDAFTLVRTTGGWRISSIAYTIERDGCPPSPLGPVEGLALSFDMEATTPDGRLRDRSGYGLHGEVEGTEVVPGARGAARRFRTVADRVHVPQHPALDLDGPLTIATWVRVDSVGIHQHIVACDDKWALWITPDDRWRLGDTRGGGWSTPAGTVRQGGWTAVAAVLRGTRGDSLGPDVAALYLNGRLAPAERHQRNEQARAAGVWNPGALYPTDACYVGFESHQGTSSHRTLPFVGAIDELRVYARALSEPEIQALARMPAGRQREPDR